jgi:dienelactone hydrolase
MKRSPVGTSQVARHLRVDASADSCLLDEPVVVAISQCEPNSLVDVTATLDADGSGYRSRAIFRADGSGKVDTRRQPSLDGSYTGVDPFGLAWSAEPIGRSAAPTPPPLPVGCQVRVESGDLAATAEFERRWLAPGATVTEVRESGIQGIFARPAGRGPFPGVVAFGGSGGGLGPAATWAPVLASRGFATLAIAYFGAPELSDALVRIEIEVVERAAQWLLDRQDIVAGAVAAMGQSRGSELALLAGALLDSVNCVVAFAPSGISWGDGLDATGPVDAPAWTFRGDDIPYAYRASAEAVNVTATAPQQPIELRGAFEAVLENDDVVQRAVIPVERIEGPMLLVSGGADAMWPSTEMGNIAVRRALVHGSDYAVVHLTYPQAGHVCAGVPGLPVVTETVHPITGECYSFGGSRTANAVARVDSWPQVLAFLRSALPSI